MKNYVESLSANPDGALTPDERNLLSVAYKNVVGSRRQAWRVLSSLEGKGSDGPNPECIKEYKKQIEEELYKCCNEVLVGYIIYRSDSPVHSLALHREEGSGVRSEIADTPIKASMT